MRIVPCWLSVDKISYVISITDYLSEKTLVKSNELEKEMVVTDDMTNWKEIATQLCEALPQVDRFLGQVDALAAGLQPGAGNEDLNDHNELRSDPALPTAVGADLSLASASTA